MKLIQWKRNYTLQIRGAKEKHYYVSFVEWSNVRSYLWAELYHKYDMVFPLVPLKWLRKYEWFKPVDKMLTRKDQRILPEEREKERDWLPYNFFDRWIVKQDLRCFELSERIPRYLFQVEITEEQWNLLKRKKKY